MGLANLAQQKAAAIPPHSNRITIRLRPGLAEVKCRRNLEKLILIMEASIARSAGN
jgi:hypothetical protein